MAAEILAVRCSRVAVPYSMLCIVGSAGSSTDLMLSLSTGSSRHLHGTQGAKPGFWVKTGTACCKRFDAKKHIYTYLGTNYTWTTLTDFCWKFVGTI